MAKAPLSVVKEKFGDKAKLVEAVEKFTTDDLWLPRTRADRANGDKGLGNVSNAKLIRLHTIFSEVKEKFGTRDKLVDAILTAEKRSKDEGYKARIGAYPVPRLYDLFKSVERRNKHAAKKSAAK